MYFPGRCRHQYRRDPQGAVCAIPVWIVAHPLHVPPLSDGGCVVLTRVPNVSAGAVNCLCQRSKARARLGGGGYHVIITSPSLSCYYLLASLLHPSAVINSLQASSIAHPYSVHMLINKRRCIITKRPNGKLGKNGPGCRQTTNQQTRGGSPREKSFLAPGVQSKHTRYSQQSVPPRFCATQCFPTSQSYMDHHLYTCVVARFAELVLVGIPPTSSFITLMCPALSQLET